MNFDLSIILPTNRPQSVAHALGYIEAQRAEGISFEVVVVQEADDYEAFKWFRYGPRYQIIRQAPNHDYGAHAKDTGIMAATGRYVCFWDDDNIFYPQAAAVVFATANGHDIGVCRVKHRGGVIPAGHAIKAGDIDTMCFCVRRELAAKVKWADGQGRLSDYRWITRIAGLAQDINWSPLIIGEHL